MKSYSVRKIIFATFAVGCLSMPAAFAVSAPDIRFDTANFTSGGTWPDFNLAAVDNTSFAGISISGFTYNGGYSQGNGFLWLRNNTNDNGLGYCSTNETCGNKDTTGDGNHNELSNRFNIEIIRLTLPTGKMWTDIWVSSLDSSEKGTLFWSNLPTPNLNATGLAAISSYTFSATGSEERSIFAGASAATGWDSTANYLFFAAGVKPLVLGLTLDNDYLVYGVNVAAIPEPEIYAMLATGLGLMGFVARRRKQQAAAA